MRNATELMVAYAKFHRDQRNIATHMVGIPLIVFSVGVLLAKPTMVVAGVNFTPALLVWLASTLWYFSRGNVALALAVSAMNLALISLAQPTATLSTPMWLGIGVGSFIVGWAIQFLGHYYEGKKPAFVDDILGLLVGPMFVAAEVMHLGGFSRSLFTEIERRVGPTHLRDLHAQATR
jgi:uncharacterized membrane protein YGL010W